MADEAYELCRNAQDSGVSKHRFAELLDCAWDAAKAEDLANDQKLEITLKQTRY